MIIIKNICYFICDVNDYIEFALIDLHIIMMYNYWIDVPFASGERHVLFIYDIFLYWSYSYVHSVCK